MGKTRQSKVPVDPLNTTAAGGVDWKRCTVKLGSHREFALVMSSSPSRTSPPIDLHASRNASSRQTMFWSILVRLKGACLLSRKFPRVCRFPRVICATVCHIRHHNRNCRQSIELIQMHPSKHDSPTCSSLQSSFCQRDGRPSDRYVPGQTYQVNITFFHMNNLKF